MTSVSSTIGALFRELVDGPSSPTSYLLNQGDAGLLRSLDKLSAAAASSTSPGRVSVAAHVDHVRYFLQRMNGWASGTDLGPADWGASWHRSQVSDDDWKELRANLATEVTKWKQVLERMTVTDDEAMRSIASSVAHLAYHFGAIRQLADATRGPREVP
jgi:hypothetical protein